VISHPPLKRGSNPDGSGHCHVFLQLVAVKMIWVSTLDFVQHKSGPSTDRCHLGIFGKILYAKDKDNGYLVNFNNKNSATGLTAHCPRENAD
tara:strand:+ start:72 stop:347 length:276 start_codon:yes stop_codon:yes gene_type:complete